jgi:ATP-dependent RNA helicase DeaD
LTEIQKFAKTRIRRQRVPSIDDVEEIRNTAVLEKIRQLMETEANKKYIALVEKLTEDDHSSLDVAAALLQMVMEKDGKAVSSPVGETELHSGSGEKTRQMLQPGKHKGLQAVGKAAPRLIPGETTRLLIKLGKKQGIRPGDIVGAITGETDLTGRQIGAIEIHDAFSLVDVPTAVVASLIEVMSRCQIKGHPVFIKPDKGGKKQDRPEPRKKEFSK